MRCLLTTIVLLGSMCLHAAGQGLPTAPRPCGTISASAAMRGTMTNIGGRYLTASGTLRILIVFVSFPDDTTPHPYWPAHQPPLSMSGFIDPDTSTHSTSPSNLTNYFNQMSLGQFHLVGDVLWVETAHSKLEYTNGGYGRANTQVIKEKVDSLVDFARYDQWTNSADFVNAPAPDGRVDMIVMVWRTNMFEYIGEASLGAGNGAPDTGFVADGKKIETGFPQRYATPLGSGVTCEYLYGDTPVKLRRTMAHEIGHWLLGGAHPYDADPLTGGKHAFWGMLCDGNRESSCANAYEREQLGWCTVPQIPRDTNLVLADYVTSGAAYKFHPLNGDPMEYFYFENHQNLSTFDDVSFDPADRGIWILHQLGPNRGMNDLRIIPSDGFWQWGGEATTSACFGQQLPLFVKGNPLVVTGLSNRDMLNTTQSSLNWMYAFRDQAGLTQCGVMFAGEYFTGAFSPNVSPVFSPSSNPSTATWSSAPTDFALEVIGQNGPNMTVRAYTNPLDASPARRFLGLDPGAGNPTLTPVPLAWGSQWTGGQSVEADVDSSEVQRSIGASNVWSTVYRGNYLQWRDSSMVYDSTATSRVEYRVRVRDRQGKYSAWSRILSINASGPSDVREVINTSPAKFGLEQNYPNPFNPTTNIGFRIAESGPVILKVYDLLGREIATLVNQAMTPGVYTVRFDGSQLASGVYFARLVSEGRAETKKIILEK